MKNSYTDKEQYYGDYLGLDKILNAQFPESDARGVDAHDEMLFIIIHHLNLWEISLTELVCLKHFKM